MASRNLLSEVARHTGSVFLATLAIQTTTFALIAITALILAPPEFARLSLIVAATMLAAGVFDLGLGITITKKYNETGDAAYLRFGFSVWIAMVPASVVLSAIAWIAASDGDIALGILLGGLLNIWNGLRAADQAREDYLSFCKSSAAFAVVRLVGGGAALVALRDPVATAVAIYGLPLVVFPFSRSFQYLAGAFTERRQFAREHVWYATHVYLSALTFIMILYLPQFVIASRLDATAVSTYGLILTFASPISLLIYSLRGVMLPKMLGSAHELETMLWSRGGLAAITAVWTLMMAGAVVVGWGLEMFYGDKYPAIRPAFLIFFTGFSATGLIGLYSLSVHTQGVPHLSLMINAGKLALLVPVLLVSGAMLNAIVGIVAAAMIVGEVLMTVTLWRRRPGCE